MKHLTLFLLIFVFSMPTFASGQKRYVYVIEKSKYTEKLTYEEIEKQSEVLLPCGGRIPSCMYSLLVNGEIAVNVKIIARETQICTMELAKQHGVYGLSNVADPGYKEVYISETDTYYRDLLKPENSKIDENFKYVCGITTNSWGTQR